MIKKPNFFYMDDVGDDDGNDDDNDKCINGWYVCV